MHWKKNGVDDRKGNRRPVLVKFDNSPYWLMPVAPCSVSGALAAFKAIGHQYGAEEVELRYVDDKDEAWEGVAVDEVVGIVFVGKGVFRFRRMRPEEGVVPCRYQYYEPEEVFPPAKEKRQFSAWEKEEKREIS